MLWPPRAYCEYKHAKRYIIYTSLAFLVLGSILLAMLR